MFIVASFKRTQTAWRKRSDVRNRKRNTCPCTTDLLVLRTTAHSVIGRTSLPAWKATTLEGLKIWATKWLPVYSCVCVLVLLHSWAPPGIFERGGNHIFHDIYVYIFVGLVKFYSIWVRYTNKKDVKVQKLTFFSIAGDRKTLMYRYFARERKKFFKILHFESVWIAPLG